MFKKHSTLTNQNISAPDFDNDISAQRLWLRDTYIQWIQTNPKKRGGLSVETIERIAPSLLSQGSVSEKTNCAGMLASLSVDNDTKEALHDVAERIGAYNDVILSEHLAID